MKEFWACPKSERRSVRQQYDKLIITIETHEREKRRCQNLLAEHEYKLSEAQKKLAKLRADYGLPTRLTNVWPTVPTPQT